MDVRLRWTLTSLLLVVTACGAGAPEGRIEIAVTDARTGATMPARLELVGPGGEVFVPPQALPLRFECLLAPLPEWAAEILSVSDRVPHRGTGTDHFYLDGEGALSVPPGRYGLRVFHGIEYTVAELTLDVAAGATSRADVALERWIDLPSEGWYSADDHVHITRRNAGETSNIAAWMRAEDLHVANLLNMGTVDQIGVTPQPGFGTDGEYRLETETGSTLLLAGQEHPRTHFLGHTITLGADRLVDERPTYIVYETTFRAGLEANGLPGFAHWAIGAAHDGITIVAPHDLVSFVEVLQFDLPWYEVWYEMLDLGFRMAPTAGTDFPCGPNYGVPGRERFYVRLDAPPTRKSFLDAVDAGRTFVTNGPIVDLEVGAAHAGDEIALATPTTLPVRARVRFDPARDRPDRVELIVSGQPFPAPVIDVSPGEKKIEARIPFDESGWIALRVDGQKIGETTKPELPPGADWINGTAFDFQEMSDVMENDTVRRKRIRPSAAHTAPVYVSVGGQRIGEGAKARQRARSAIARLDDLAARLDDERIGDQTIWDWFPYSDGVPLEHLQRNRPALLEAIARARAAYEAILDGV